MSLCVKYIIIYVEYSIYYIIVGSDYILYKSIIISMDIIHIYADSGSYVCLF